MRTTPLLLAGLTVLGLGASHAHAQGTSSDLGGVAESGMEQGEASVATRSDVTVSLESVPGTSGARVAVLGRAVSGAMTEVRACYAQALERAPTTHGLLRLRLDLPARGRGATSVLADVVQEQGLLRCVSALLEGLSLDPTMRPASVVVVLDFDNTVAQGAPEVARRQRAAEAVDVTREGDRPTARDGASGVSFEVRGAAGASDEEVADAIRVLRSALPGMLDCRRRAGRRGQSPAGVIPLTLPLRAATAPAPSVGRGATVRDPRAAACVARAIASAHRRPSTSERVEAEIQFDP